MKKILKSGVRLPQSPKLDLKMKLSILFLFSTLFILKANDSYSQKAKVTLNIVDSTISEVIDEIETKTEFKFFYNTRAVDLDRVVSVKIKKGTIETVLNQLFSNVDTKYEVKNRKILLFRKAYENPKEKIEQEEPEEDLQQVVEGAVTNENGTPLPGANVIEKGTTNGVQTDFDGNFSITIADENAVLIFSYIGYSTQEVSVAAQTTIAVQMKPDAAKLDEVILTGYATQSKRTITGAVEIVDLTEAEKNPAVSIEQKLQGQVSGLNVVASGDPGSAVNVRIRGFGTTGDNNPLYVIDGVPSIGGGLNEINPDDIESISVLKDASSASIYGARGANGVILITTKRGIKGQAPEFTYSSWISAERNFNSIGLLNAQQWADMEFQGQAAGGVTPTHPVLGTGNTPVIPEFLNGDSSLPYDATTNQLIRSADTDWFDEINRTAISQNHNLSVVGGGENSRYGASFGYLEREGTLINTSFDRYSLRVNSEFTGLDGKFRVGENVSIAYSERNGLEGSPRFARYNPLIPVYDEGGNFGGTLNGTLGLGTNFENPVAALVRRENQINRTLRVFGGAYAQYEITPELSIKTNVGINYTQMNNSRFTPLFPEGGGQGNNLSEFSAWNSEVTWTNTLDFSKSFGDHTISALAGTESIVTKTQFTTVSGENFFTEDPAFTFLDGASASTIAVNGTGSQRNLASVFGKVDYAFANKYLINATVRRDGSSALGANNRFDIFPAVGLGWIISEESFLEDNSAINQLKLRAGWGRSGNQNSLTDFAFSSRFAANPIATGYDIAASNGGFQTGVALLSRGNEDLVWETSETINVGVDFAVLDNKLTGSIEWYDRVTNDLIVDAPVPLTSGIASPAFVNLGEIKNTGWDISLTYSDEIGEDFSFGVTGIVSTYKNEVLDLDGNPTTFIDGQFGNPNIIATRTQAGQPISSFYGLVVDGVLQQDTDRNNDGTISSDETAGNFNFRDINGDGVIDPNDDSDYIGTPHPDFIYSLNLNAEYKNFDFTVFFRGSQGNEIWNATKTFTDFQFRTGINRSTRVLNAWRPDNPTNSLAEFNQNTSNNSLQASSYYVEDGSYLRLQTLQIGYTFPEFSPKIKNLRMYIQAQNLFTITNYQGVDPELVEDTDSLDKGVDTEFTYTLPTSFVYGVNLKF